MYLQNADNLHFSTVFTFSCEHTNSIKTLTLKVGFFFLFSTYRKCIKICTSDLCNDIRSCKDLIFKVVCLILYIHDFQMLKTLHYYGKVRVNVVTALQIKLSFMFMLSGPEV